MDACIHRKLGYATDIVVIALRLVVSTTLVVLSAVPLTFRVFWDVTLRRRVTSVRRFDELYLLHFHGSSILLSFCLALTIKAIRSFETSGHSLLPQQHNNDCPEYVILIFAAVCIRVC